MEEIYARRRDRLRKLIDDRFDGVDGAFADEVQRPRPNISQLLSGNRRMGEDIARSIEEHMKLPPYWMEGLDLAADDLELISAINNLPKDRKAFILHYVAAETAMAEHAALSNSVKSSRTNRKKR